MAHSTLDPRGAAGDLVGVGDSVADATVTTATATGTTDTVADATATDDTVATGTVTDATAVILGKIAGPCGVKGWLKVHSFTRPPAQILRYQNWLLAADRGAGDAAWRPARVESTREASPKLLAKLTGVDDRTAGAALAGRWIAVAESQLEKLPAGEYYWSDLIGLTVVNRDGVELGAVENLIETGANDVLVVRDGGLERLLPWAPRVIDEVEMDAGRLRVDWGADWDAPAGDSVAADVADVAGVSAAGAAGAAN